MVTVLLVEDEPHLRVFFRTVLERSGYTVIEANDGVEALEVVRQHPIGVVVADVVMPRMGGRELVWRLSQTSPHIPVILVSGMLPPDHMDREDVAAAAYLMKPLGAPELLEAVASVLPSAPPDGGRP